MVLGQETMVAKDTVPVSHSIYPELEKKNFLWLFSLRGTFFLICHFLRTAW
jgi:hypothetical protein